jgi:glucose/arabinose dehydrogenase
MDGDIGVDVLHGPEHLRRMDREQPTSEARGPSFARMSIARSVRGTTNTSSFIVPRASPKVPPGFQAELFASDLKDHACAGGRSQWRSFRRRIRAGPNSRPSCQRREAKPREAKIFASGLDSPFGMAFYPPGLDPQWIYIANTGSVVRYPYRRGDLQARGRAFSRPTKLNLKQPRMIAERHAGGRNGWHGCGSG